MNKCDSTPSNRHPHFNMPNVLTMLEAKKKGRQLERGKMYEVAYSHHDGTTVNATMAANIVSL